MVLISFTNIIVDDFGYAKRNPLKRYIYFLTHMHSDHYQGMSNTWDYGQIFCSQMTKQLLLVKFPNQTNAIALPMKTPTEIKLSNEKPDYKCQVTLLDANHCPGSVMILFQGYFGTILHTGDMRFNLEMIYNNPHLYPNENLQLRLLKAGQEQDERLSQIDGISIHIDEMILDNTYCDPIFKFPDRDEAFNMICEIIDKHSKDNNDLRVLLCVDSVGKEELMVQLANHYNTLIVVNEQRFEIVQSIDFHTQLFTTIKNQGWIEVIRKNEVHLRLKDKNTIAITATGWANTTGYQMPDNRKYVIPYSLHSNFHEMHQFVRSIKPCILQKVVKNKDGKSEKIYNITEFSQYMVTLHHLKQRGFEFFLKNYTDKTKLSPEYLSLLTDPSKQRQINQDLGIILNVEEKQLVNQKEFQEKNKLIFQSKNKYDFILYQRVVKGAKMTAPEENDQFKITEFMRLKKQIENQQQAKSKVPIIISDTPVKQNKPNEKIEEPKSKPEQKKVQRDLSPPEKKKDLSIFKIKIPAKCLPKTVQQIEEKQQ